jgi:uncharacterized Zn finger protein (UPF0148 family)
MAYIWKCPKCGTDKIDQYRMPYGAIWCGNCNYRVEHKEIKNPFVTIVKEKKNDK